MKKRLIKFFCVLMLFFSCLPVAGSDEPDPGQKFQGFNLQGYADNGEKAWDVAGDTADIVGTEVKLSNVTAYTYGKDKVKVTAENGTLDQVSGEMYLEKDVIVTSETGAQLLTDSLNWSRTNDLVSTNDDVIITNTEQGLTVTGKGMEAKPGLKNAQIHEDVIVRVDTQPNKAQSNTVTISSDGPMILDQTRYLATFEDNVVAVQEGRTLKADRMEVYFDSETNNIKEMVCTGHVEIVQGENRTYADKAVYNAADKKLTLSGRPKLIMQIEGEDAVTSFGNKESR